ncbi:Protein of unknown function [Dyadobacter sp. SG02]|uniref:DUF416 family protein n=1 Tax=Dyadobacter sp. SG02 TaxID=1855291 RepID=UPI0008B0FFF0|nr:DUF416 family protein [Dyadobacter sp. SG02]SEJ36020.1 Protein of unknown function [Dyadobacter sp. SG02]
MDNFQLDIRAALLSLSDKGRLLFAAITCVHLYPNYENFVSAFGWGSPQVIQHVIDEIFLILREDRPYSERQIKDLIDAVDVVIPDTEDFSDIACSQALDAGVAVLSTLEYIKARDLESVVNVAICARDTVDMFIQVRDDFNSNDPSCESRIESDYLMVREKARQELLIKQLAILKLDAVSDGLIKSLLPQLPIIE